MSNLNSIYFPNLNYFSKLDTKNEILKILTNGTNMEKQEVFTSILNLIYFNAEHDENHSINLDGDDVKVWHGNVWVNISREELQCIYDLNVSKAIEVIADLRISYFEEDKMLKTLLNIKYDQTTDSTSKHGV